MNEAAQNSLLLPMSFMVLWSFLLATYYIVTSPKVLDAFRPQLGFQATFFWVRLFLKPRRSENAQNLSGQHPVPTLEAKLASNFYEEHENAPPKLQALSEKTSRSEKLRAEEVSKMSNDHQGSGHIPITSKPASPSPLDERLENAKSDRLVTSFPSDGHGEGMQVEASPDQPSSSTSGHASIPQLSRTERLQLFCESIVGQDLSWWPLSAPRRRQKSSASTLKVRISPA
jgi:hypothetical protein